MTTIDDVIDERKRSLGLVEGSRAKAKKAKQPGARRANAAPPGQPEDITVARGHGFGARTEDGQPVGQFVPTGKFGRMFPNLTPLIADEAALKALGAAMLDNAEQNPSGDNADIPAGFTYLGQFIDHDITFDTTALGELLVDPLALHNFRTPALDLDSVYGLGPVAQPYLYDRDSGSTRMEIGRTGPGGIDPTVKPDLPFDLPRAANKFALLGDPRNDENLVVAQTHLAFLRFHNKVVDWFTEDPARRDAPLRKTLFEEARDTVIWHYQWIVVHDFLRRLLDQEQLDAVLNCGNEFYAVAPGGDAFIPLEFAGAAYRFGHSMVREVYDYNRVFSPKPGAATPATLGLLFRFTGLSGSSVPVPSDWIIDWRRFYDIDAAVTPGATRLVDPLLAPQLHTLPGGVEPVSLAVRNLLRGRKIKLPSGQSVARCLGFEPLSKEQIGTGDDGAVAAEHNLDAETPLWYYVLKEAQVQQQGKRLGQVGSRIVAEVFLGLLRADAGSYLRRKPNWAPTLPSATAGTFTMADLLRFNGDLSPVDDSANIVGN